MHHPLRYCSRIAAIALILLSASLCQAQWTDISDVSDAWAIGSHNGRLYAATSSAGVFTSTDDGMNWSHLPGFPAGACQAFCSEGDRLFATVSSDKIGGAYWSSDDGLTWTRGTGFPASVDAIDITATPAGLFLSADQRGVYRSTDHGTHWILKSSGMTDRSTRFVRAQGRTLYASTPNTLYRSTNDGDAWTQIGQSTFTGSIYCLGLSSDSSELLVSSRFEGLSQSTDNGETWKAWTLPSLEAIYRITGGGKWLYVATTSTIYMTSNDGANWLPTSLASARVAQRFGTTVLAAHDGGISRSTDDGANWERITIGAANSGLTTILDVNGSIVAGTYFKGVLISTNDGAKWSAYPVDAKPRQVNQLVRMGDDLFAATDTGIYVSHDFGHTWATTGRTTGNFIILSRVQDLLFGVAGSKLYRSSDKGGTWTSVSSIPYAYAPVIDLHGKLFTLDAGVVTVSTNEGVNWKKLTDPLFDGPGDLVQSNGNLIATQNGNAMVLSTDDGATWQKLAPNAAYIAAFGSYVFASIDSGMSISSDGGLTWKFERGQLRLLQGQMSADARHLFSTWPGFAMRNLSEFDPTMAVRPSHGKMESFSVYPNPATSTLSFTVPQEMKGRMTLTIYDALGRVVVENAAPVSTHSLDLRSYMPGIYTVRITSHESSQQFLAKVVVAR